MSHFTINRVVSLEYYDVPVQMDNQPFFNFQDFVDPRDKRYMHTVGKSWFVDDEGRIEGLSPSRRSYWFDLDHLSFGETDESFDNVMSVHSIYVQVERKIIYDVPPDTLTPETFGDTWTIDSNEVLTIQGVSHRPVVAKCIYKLVKANGVVIFSGSL